MAYCMRSISWQLTFLNLAFGANDCLEGAVLYFIVLFKPSDNGLQYITHAYTQATYCLCEHSFQNFIFVVLYHNLFTGISKEWNIELLI